MSISQLIIQQADYLTKTHLYNGIIEITLINMTYVIAF